MTRPMLDFDYCGHGVFWANSGNMSFMIEGQVMDGSPYECTTYLNKRHRQDDLSRARRGHGGLL
jgi:hypothetical protein